MTRNMRCGMEEHQKFFRLHISQPTSYLRYTTVFGTTSYYSNSARCGLILQCSWTAEIWKSGTLQILLAKLQPKAFFQSILIFQIRSVSFVIKPELLQAALKKKHRRRQRGSRGSNSNPSLLICFFVLKFELYFIPQICSNSPNRHKACPITLFRNGPRLSNFRCFKTRSLLSSTVPGKNRE